MKNNSNEWQFDGLVGPTHNYAGLATGNLAAAYHAGTVSNPRQAALQGLKKMLFVRDLGFKQAFLPPHYRPMLRHLQALGFQGDTGSMLHAAATQAPSLLASVYSSSFMWTANAATIAPSADTEDVKLYLTVANLVSHFHRSIEAKANYHILKRIFHNESLFVINYALQSCDLFSDEGAANHMRIINNNGDKGKNLFIYGKDEEKTLEKIRFRSRQKQEASRAVARLHRLPNERCLFFQQSPTAISAGVFHNDVIAMNTNHCMIIHASAFITEHQAALRNEANGIEGFHYREVTEEELSLKQAVSSYLFNSQLLYDPAPSAAGKFILVAPVECSEQPAVKRLIDRFLDEGLINEVHYLDVRESMHNGGGPACLRLRVTMTPQEENAIHSGIILTDAKYQALTEWVTTHYRDRLCFDDLRDPLFVEELDRAYQALEKIIDMPGLYTELAQLI